MIFEFAVILTVWFSYLSNFMVIQLIGIKFSTKKVYRAFFVKIDGFRPKAIFMKKMGQKYLLKHKCPMFKTSFVSCIFQEHRY